MLHMERAVSVDGSSDGASCTGNGSRSGFLAIMDQHAADERVQLELLQDALLQVWPLTSLAHVRCRETLHTCSRAICQTAEDAGMLLSKSRAVINGMIVALSCEFGLRNAAGRRPKAGAQAALAAATPPAAD